MKKGLSVILSLVLIITCLPFSVSAWPKRYDCGDYSYTLKNGKATLARYEGKGEKIFKIPSKLDGYPVVKIRVFAFEGIGFETVIIPEGVKKIAGSAFAECEKLKTIKIPKSVTKLENGFLYECNNMVEFQVDEQNDYYCDVDGVLFDKDKTTLIKYPPKKADKCFEIPKETTSINPYAFYLCYPLESITMPDNVKTIGEWAFSGCSNLEDIKMSKNLTRIGEDAFGGTKYWKNLDNWKNHGLYIDNYLVEILNGNVDVALASKRPDKYTITESTKLISDSTFAYYDNLKTLTIPKSVKYIGKNVFRDCLELTEINVDDENPYFCDVDGVLFNKSKTRLIRFPACKNTANYEIPKSVKKIDKDAFSWSKHLKSVSIPDSVTVLKEKTFYFCKKLTSITLPKKLTKIENEAFKSCIKLKSIKLPKKLTKIGREAFCYCKKLKKVEIKGKAPTLSSLSFWCTKNIKFYLKNKTTAKSLKKQLENSGAKNPKIYYGKKLYK